MSNELAASASAFIQSLEGGDGDFRPFAYYDKHLDCIRVQVTDCSFKEERKNRIITVLTANHVEQNSFVGFNIKGVKYLFEEMGLPVSGVIKLTDLIDKLVQFFPDAAVKHVQEAFRPILTEQDLSVQVP